MSFDCMDTAKGNPDLVGVAFSPHELKARDEKMQRSRSDIGERQFECADIDPNRAGLRRFQTAEWTGKFGAGRLPRGETEGV